MKAMPTKLAETEASLKNTRRQQLERERRPTEPKQPRVSSPRWLQPELLFFRLPPCCHAPHGMGSAQSICPPSFGPSCGCVVDDKVIENG